VTEEIINSQKEEEEIIGCSTYIIYNMHPRNILIYISPEFGAKSTKVAFPNTTASYIT